MTILKWKEQYGDVFTVYDGRKPMVILSNFTTVRKVFADDAVSGRDDTSIVRVDGSTTFGQGLLFSQGDLWKTHRRFALSTLRDLGMGKNWMEDTIITEVEHFCQLLRDTKQRPFDPKAQLTNSISNVICALIFGQRFDLNDPKFSELTSVISTGVDCLADDSLGQALPFLMWFPNPVRSHVLRVRGGIRSVLAFLKARVDEHASAVNKHDDVQDYLYAYQSEKENGSKTGSQDTFNGQHNS